MISIGKDRQYNLTAKIVVTNEDKVMFKREVLEFSCLNLYNGFFPFRLI